MQASLECEAHGTTTKLTCAECGTPICTRCLVKTDVGLKCAEHAQANVAPAVSRRVAPLVISALVLVAMGGVILVAARQMASDTPPRVVVPGQPVGPAAAIDTPQVFVMGADGSQPRTLTNRPGATDAHPAWSPKGDRIAFESVTGGRRAVWTMQTDGLLLRRLTDGDGTDGAPAWSPDGSRIAFMSDRDGNFEVYVMAADGTDVRRLTSSPSTDGYPAWSPDGTRIAFVSDRPAGAPGGPSATLRLHLMAPDGSGVTPVTDVQAVPERPAWSPDGARLAFASDRHGDPELYLVGVDGSAPTRLTTDPAADGEPSWSPDGARLAFASNRDGNAQVYLVNPDGSGLRRLTTEPRNYGPAFSPDGARLVYIHEPTPEAD